MPSNVSIARRYARALLDVTGPSADEVLGQLEAFAKLFEDHKELHQLATDPSYTRAQRRGVVDALIAQAGAVKPELAQFLRLLVDRNRLDWLADITRVFRSLTDLRAGRLRGKVTSAKPLTAEMVGSLEKSLERVTQRDVVLESQVNPALLGGVTAQVGPWMFDGSLKSQLVELRSELLSGRRQA